LNDAVGQVNGDFFADAIFGTGLEQVRKIANASFMRVSTATDSAKARCRAIAESLVLRLRLNSVFPTDSRNANGTMSRK
jgi:hypothetical protein